ncbi:MAG: 4-hydroxy-tetrahydrodipicolinate reductase [Hyphomicrobiales bacterium]|nr:4-hydroxy-tetrahydrodipicolinate reductase [Hyphomicrobiales bacterium]
MRIGITGCAGRMGRMLVETVLATDGVTLAGGTESPNHAVLGADLGALAGRAPTGLIVTDDVAGLCSAADVIIDFTAPAASARHAQLAAQSGVAFVCGTTGLDGGQKAALKTASGVIPVVFAANMSVGVNLLQGLTRRVAALLGEDYDIEIVEMHHKHKADAPSGTALALGQAAADGRRIALDTASVRVRDGHTGPRADGSIGFATLRGGDVVGEHTVIFAGPGERIELSHKAASRTIFANGAVRAAKWIAGRPAGLYSMHDVLGLD